MAVTNVALLPHRQRVFDEKKDLDFKIDRIHHMKEYSSILESGISRF